MRNLSRRLRRRFERVPVWYGWLAASGSFLGFLDAFYLTLMHERGGRVPCSITLGCEKVLSSAYATVGPLPLALLGTIYYLAIFLSAVAYLHTRSGVFGAIISLFPFAGFAISVWLFFLQAFILDAFCAWCLFSGALAFVLFCASIIQIISARQRCAE